jgi:hypothetical protein
LSALASSHVPPVRNPEKPRFLVTAGGAGVGGGGTTDSPTQCFSSSSSSSSSRGVSKGGAAQGLGGRRVLTFSSTHATVAVPVWQRALAQPAQPPPSPRSGQNCHAEQPTSPQHNSRHATGVSAVGCRVRFAHSVPFSDDLKCSGGHAPSVTVPAHSADSIAAACIVMVQSSGAATVAF